jgi:hypothetical protein
MDISNHNILHRNTSSQTFSRVYNERIEILRQLRVAWASFKLHGKRPDGFKEIERLQKRLEDYDSSRRGNPESDTK